MQVVFFARTLWNTVTGNEEHSAQTEAERRVAKATQSATKETSVGEVLDATKKEKEKIMETNASFTNAEKKAKEFVKEQVTKIAAQVGRPGSDESNEKKK